MLNLSIIMLNIIDIFYHNGCDFINMFYKENTNLSLSPLFPYKIVLYAFEGIVLPVFRQHFQITQELLSRVGM